MSNYENNQYGNGVTKPLPTGCIKDSDNISWKIFKNLLESVSFQDTMGHLYIIDIEPTTKFIPQLLKNKKL